MILLSLCALEEVSNSPGLCLLDAGSTPLHVRKPKMSQTLPNVPCGQNHPLWRSTASDGEGYLRKTQ